MKYLYTKTAAKQLLPFATEIEQVREYRNCVQCTYWVGAKRRSTFLSKKAFLKLEKARLTQAASVIEIVKVHPEEDAVVVKSSDKTKFYTVRPNHPDPRFKCECERAYYVGAKCRHQEAVESYLSQQPSTPNYTSEQVLPILPEAFGWGAVPAVRPTKTYFSQQRVQILIFSDWAQEGSYLIVDTRYNKVVYRYGYRPSAAAWDKVVQLRQQYLDSLFGIDAEILKIGVKKQDEVKVVRTGAEQHSVFVNGELAGKFAYDDWAMGNQYVVEIGGVEFGWFPTRAAAEGAIVKQARSKAPVLQTA
jgi:hypothetical protein